MLNYGGKYFSDKYLLADVLKSKSAPMQEFGEAAAVCARFVLCEAAALCTRSVLGEVVALCTRSVLGEVVALCTRPVLGAVTWCAH